MLRAVAKFPQHMELPGNLLVSLSKSSPPQLLFQPAGCYSHHSRSTLTKNPQFLKFFSSFCHPQLYTACKFSIVGKFSVGLSDAITILCQIHEEDPLRDVPQTGKKQRRPTCYTCLSVARKGLPKLIPIPYLSKKVDKTTCLSIHCPWRGQIKSSGNTSCPQFQVYQQIFVAQEVNRDLQFVPRKVSDSSEQIALLWGAEGRGELVTQAILAFCFFKVVRFFSVQLLPPLYCINQNNFPLKRQNVRLSFPNLFTSSNSH